ncbi:MAG: MarR family transcriptional regulator [Candidatus Nealsonbacteria bacterium]|nr:MarR family transcriptional regulator [Candidatus Nealsonbacteria bacterium]
MLDLDLTGQETFAVRHIIRAEAVSTADASRYNQLSLPEVKHLLELLADRGLLTVKRGRTPRKDRYSAHPLVKEALEKKILDLDLAHINQIAK